MSLPEADPPAESDAAGASLPEPRPPGRLDVPRAGTSAARRLEIRAALLLIGMSLLIGAAVLYLMWARGAFQATQRLTLTTDDSEGVSVGMDMTFSGFPIGRVGRIELGEGGVVRILVDVPVKDVHWLRQSSVFTLEKGLVGAARLRAFTGVPDDDPLPPNAERMVLRGDVSAEIPKMVADARDVLQNLNSLTSAESSLAGALSELRAFTGKLNGTEGGVLAAVTGNESDGKRVSELLDRANQLLKTLDSTVKKADQQVLGDKGLLTDAQAVVQEMNGLLQGVRRSMVMVDSVLKDAEVVAGNAREATTDLGDLRADVEGSLRKIDSLITEINRKWPFAPKEKEVKLP